MSEQLMYFMFSELQLQFQKQLYKKMGKPYIDKYVLFNGSKYQYTEILNNQTNNKYSDAKMVAYGTLSSMKYDK